jgi:hypothetical protein
MLLGCCHCGQTPSESTPPSQSSASSSGIIETIIGGCGTFPVLKRCLNKVAPARFSVAIPDPGGASAVCQPFYVGSFTLFFISNSCFEYQSAELVKKLSGATCVDHSAARFRAGIGGAVFGGNTQIALQALYHSGGFEVAIASYGLNAGAININCVNSFTLTKSSTDSLGFKFPNTVVITPS